MRKLPVIAVVIAVLSISSGRPVRAAASAVTYWNEVASAAVATGRTGPPGLLDQALVQAAVHDAVQAIEGRYEPYFATVPDAEGSTSAAVAAAAYTVLAEFYPTQRPGPTGLDQLYLNYVTANGLTGNPGLAVGESAGDQIAALRRPTPTLPANTGGTGIGEWRPTPPANLTGQFEFLGQTEPFTLLRPSQFRPQQPPPIVSMQYTRDYNEVKAYGSATSTVRTALQTDMAYFWSENFITQWNRALRSIAIAHINDLGDAARLFALANLAAADSAITAFESKYHFNYWRPITAIREGDNDGNPRTDGDAGWNALIATPPYPDYSSGANNLTGAFTRTLELFFGRDNFAFSVTSNAALAVQKTRNYTRFSQAADEVVEARILLGIHFRSADEVARIQGSRVAHWVFMRFLRPVPGGHR
jgi:hypothetical protein